MSAAQVRTALASLERLSTPRDLANLARFGITATKPIGVSVGNIQVVAKQFGRSHELALGLWDTGRYEARMLTGFVEEPGRVTVAQMDRWARDFDNWAICDTLCFHVWDRTPHAWSRVARWNDRRAEFVKRSAYALIASLALHDNKAPDAPFIESLDYIEGAATDERNFVKKGVSWALRGVGRRNPKLNAAAKQVARRLSASEDPTARWVGKDALKDLTRAKR